MSNNKEISYEVDEALMKRIYFALETGRDNAIEAYNQHINSTGKLLMSNKEKRLALLYKKDIDEVESIIKELSDNWQFGR